MRMQTLPPAYRALVVGAGGIGTALHQALRADPRCAEAVLAGRGQALHVDVLDEPSIRAAAARLRGCDWHLMIVATGTLMPGGARPEKSLAAISPETLANAFAINTTGPALLLKHFADLLPRAGKSIFACLSARVGSIGDNRLGGWYAYRASKAALNQIVRTASIEIARKRPEARILALHPGTVRTPLSRPFVGETGMVPGLAAAKLLAVIDAARESGVFLDHNGHVIPW
jgi:NAD(P)-dependent dehydrogenase (short-subunit alcohol dehydrogenase family)